MTARRTTATRTGVPLTPVEGEGPISSLRLALYTSGALLGLATWLVAAVIGIAALVLAALA